MNFSRIYWSFSLSPPISSEQSSSQQALCTSCPWVRVHTCRTAVYVHSTECDVGCLHEYGCGAVGGTCTIDQWPHHWRNETSIPWQPLAANSFWGRVGPHELLPRLFYFSKGQRIFPSSFCSAPQFSGFRSLIFLTQSSDYCEPATMILWRLLSDC